MCTPELTIVTRSVIVLTSLVTKWIGKRVYQKKPRSIMKLSNLKYLFFSLLLTTALLYVVLPDLELYFMFFKDSIFNGEFSNKMTQYDMVTAKLLLKRFASEMESANMTYFLYSGSLLGSYRHRGIVPWDDDIDVIVPFRQRPDLRTTLSELEPLFTLDTSMDIRWKFYSILSEAIKTKSWKWPFLDISFYFENETHIWDTDRRWRLTSIYNKSIVFPLGKGSFMNMSLPVPKDPYAFLSFNFDVNICKSNSYDHKQETSIPYLFQTSVPCYILRKRFQFVNHD
ncbi:uncharacterized protein RT0683-like [Gigantopelta aegis]|uniref:uncharacterized protein RT0683-like n=1 Tax=Gigantopelta aegis TaxID=1735272 RepID=UPI001B888B7C|nr:uncharacterized protein RT0683-like [Gigantopelta aegis]